MSDKDFKLEFTSVIGLLTYLPGMHYIEIPKKIIDQLGGLNNRLICTVNNSISYQCGTMALGDGKGYITISKPRMKKLNVENGSRVEVKLEPDHSEFGTPVPEELDAVFASDKEGYERFLTCTKAMQRYIINYVGSVKSTEKRIERALLLIGNLKTQPQGKENFRAMLGLPPREG